MLADNQMTTDKTESRLQGVQQALLADMEAMQAALPHDGEETSEALPVGRHMRLSGRGDKPVRDIERDDVLVRSDGSSDAIYGQKSAAKLPKRFDLHFLDAAGDYGASHVSARFEAGEQPVARLNLPVAMGRAMAQGFAQRLLHAARGEHETISMRLPHTYLDLEIGDIISFDGLLWRITEITHGRVLEVSALRHQPQIFSRHTRAQDDEDVSPIGDQIARPELHILELPAPALRFHANAGDAPLLAAFAAPWPQTVQLRRATGPAASVVAPSIMGETANELVAMPAGRWQRDAVLEVKLFGGTLAGLPDDEVLAGGNRLAVRGETDWEIIQFAHAELVGEHHYELRDLLRGQFGSVVQRFNSGAVFVVLGAAQVPLVNQLDQLSENFTFRYGSPALPQDGYGWQQGHYELTLAARRCLSPVHGRIDWPEGFNAVWHIGWVRRSRIGGDDFAAAETPLGETEEAYRVTLLGDGDEIDLWHLDKPVWQLTPPMRRDLRRRQSAITDWQLAIAQINSRGEAGVPLLISLPMNEESDE